MINIGIVSYAHVHVLKYAPTIASHPDACIVGIVGIGPNKELAKKDADYYKCDYYENLENLFSRDDLDAIYVGTEASEHKEVVQQAAEHGIHVLCDKPIALNLKDADEIIEVARKNNIKLMVPFNPRFQLPMIKAKEMIDNGEIGDLQYIYAVKFGKNPQNIKDFDTSWFFDTKKSGCGGFGDIGIHAIDALRWLIGDEADKVYADIRYNEEGIDEMGIATIEFRNGVITSLISGWTFPFGSAPWLDVKFEILGKNGALVIDKPLYEPVWDFQIFTSEKAEHQDLGRRDVPANVDEFINCIMEDREPAITGEDAKAALEIVLAAYESAKTGMEVKLR
ncbi:MAG TPA: Gfo/Idh/MocA family oxidoreductase [Methanosarcinales archaeon]|nr:Gfo/Idh/MocA family oxidoreductase [Methanosarcinales archaeon]